MRDFSSFQTILLMKEQAGNISCSREESSCSEEESPSLQFSSGKRKRKSSNHKARPLKCRRDMLPGAKDHGRELHIPNLMKKIHTKENDKKHPILQ